MVLAARGFGRCVGVAGLLGVLMLSGALAQSAGQWQTGAPMPSARSEVAVAVVEDEVYVVGGFRGNKELEIYHPAADNWTRGASIPRALHHAAAVGLGGRLYVVGGTLTAGVRSIRSMSTIRPRIAGARGPLCSRPGIT